LERAAAVRDRRAFTRRASPATHAAGSRAQSTRRCRRRPATAPATPAAAAAAAASLRPTDASEQRPGTRRDRAPARGACACGTADRSSRARHRSTGCGPRACRAAPRRRTAGCSAGRCPTVGCSSGRNPPAFHGAGRSARCGCCTGHGAARSGGSAPCRRISGHLAAWLGGSTHGRRAPSTTAAAPQRTDVPRRTARWTQRSGPVVSTACTSRALVAGRSSRSNACRR